MSNSPLKTNRHPIRAFVLTPFVAALTFAIGYFALTVWLQNWPADDVVPVAFISAMAMPVVTVVVALVMVVLVLPIFYSLRRLQIENAVVTVALAGVVAGATYALPLLTSLAGDAAYFSGVRRCQAGDGLFSMNCELLQFLLGGGCFVVLGMVSGVAFWRLYAGAWVWRFQASSRSCSLCA